MLTTYHRLVVVPKAGGRDERCTVPLPRRAQGFGIDAKYKTNADV